MKLVEKKYDKKIVKKPWGYEYVLYRNKNSLSVTLLKINSDQQTSLHCHPNKKTGFILLSGKADIQLGLFKSGIKSYSSPSKLMIRSGLFHSIQAKSKNGLLALELETPYKKNDLVRFEDWYGRQMLSYEKNTYRLKKGLKIIKEQDFKKNRKFNFGKVKLSFELHKDFSKINKSKPSNIFAILGGKVVDSKKRNILSLGDIVKTGTLKKLSERFSISEPLKILKVGKAN